MKTVLIGIDFSATSIHAANFAYFFAKRIKSDVILCNAVENSVIATRVADSVNQQQTNALLKVSLKRLNGVKNQLHEHKDGYLSFKPAIQCLSDIGCITEVINKVIINQPIDLVVIGTHGTGGLLSFLLGRESRNMIDGTNKPLMLIPPAAAIGSIKRIAFASDFNNKNSDLASMHILIGWASLLNAEILLTHIHEDEDHSASFLKWMDEFITELSQNANYPHIYHRAFRSEGHESGLLWLSENGKIDILALQYRSHTFFDSLFRGSQSDTGTRALPIPVIIFPSRL